MYEETKHSEPLFCSFLPLDAQIGDNFDGQPDVGNFINNRIKDAENPDDDPFNDSTHEFNHEGGDSEAGSLSSLASSSTDASQDYDYLRGWGDKFARLADMYGAGEDLGD